MNTDEKMYFYALNKLRDSMRLLMKAEASDERKELREQAAAYAAIVTALHP